MSAADSKKKTRVSLAAKSPGKTSATKRIAKKAASKKGVARKSAHRRHGQLDINFNDPDLLGLTMFVELEKSTLSRESIAEFIQQTRAAVVVGIMRRTGLTDAYPDLFTLIVPPPPENDGE